MTKAKKPEVAASAFESVGFAVMFCEEIVVGMFSAGEACEEEFIDDDEEPADLYKGSFSLTYGTVTLLRETKLHLKKFRSYGLLGPTNGGEAYEEEFIDDDEEPADSYKGSFSLAYGTVTLLRETKLHLKKFKSYGLLGPYYQHQCQYQYEYKTLEQACTRDLSILQEDLQIFIPGGQAAEPHAGLGPGPLFRSCSRRCTRRTTRSLPRSRCRPTRAASARRHHRGEDAGADVHPRPEHLAGGLSDLHPRRPGC